VSQEHNFVFLNKNLVYWSVWEEEVYFSCQHLIKINNYISLYNKQISQKSFLRSLFDLWPLNISHLVSWNLWGFVIFHLILSFFAHWSLLFPVNSFIKFRNFVKVHKFNFLLIFLNVQDLWLLFLDCCLWAYFLTLMLLLFLDILMGNLWILNQVRLSALTNHSVFLIKICQFWCR